MSYVKTKGIVIREVNTGEADKIVTIFSKSRGKISGSAKNARRTRNSLAAGTQFLCYSELVLYKGRDMYTVTNCDVIESFYEIRNDIFKLTYSAHIVDLINDVILEDQPSTKVLQLFLNTLHMLAKTDKSPELLVRIFEFRLLAILGYAPHVRSCMVCGKEEFDRISFSFKKCGFVCGECIIDDQYATKISPGVAKAIFHIIHASMSELFSFSLSPDALEELAKVSRRYLKDRLEKDYKKLDFLKTLDIKG